MDGRETPESGQPPGEPRTAGVLRRLAAAVYDAFLLIALLMVAGAAWLPVTGGEAVPAGHLGFQLYLLTVIAVFHIGFWTNGGQTLGMRAWRIKVEMPDSSSLDLIAATRRFLFALIAWLPAGLGVMWCLVDREGSALHDRWSGTRVVHRPK
jgi:uncharacterized RDD family membrane protein YckC